MEVLQLHLPVTVLSWKLYGFKLIIEWFASSEQLIINLSWLTCRLKIILNTERSIAALDKILPEI